VEPTFANVHEEVLRGTGEFFQSRLKPDQTSKEDDLEVIDMSEHKAAIIRLYIKWLYSGKVDIALGLAKYVRVATNGVYIKLVNAYIFGFEVLDTAYQHAIVELFHATLAKAFWLPAPRSANLLS
jgi:hypothetical protein